MPRHKVNTLLAFLPLYGYTGDAINEGQLVNALSRYVKSVYCFTYANLYQILSRKNRKMAVPLNANVKVIDIPALPLSYLFLIINILYHFIIALLYISIGWFFKPDALYVRSRLLAFNLQMLKHFINKPILYKFDNFAIDEIIPTIKQSTFRRFITKMLWLIDYTALRNSNIILVPSEASRDLVMRRTALKKLKFLICPAGVDTKKLDEIRNFRKDGKNEIIIGFLGSLSWWQGVDILAEAIALLKDRFPKLKLLLIGDGKLRNKIIEICKKLMINYEITGFIPHEKALELLRTVDIMVLPRLRTSTTEYIIPIKVIEAFGLGVPVICTPHKVMLERFKDYEDVIYAKPTKVDIADKIGLLLSNEKLKDKLSRRGPNIAKDFDYDIIAKNLIRSIE